MLQALAWCNFVVSRRAFKKYKNKKITESKDDYRLFLARRHLGSKV